MVNRDKRALARSLIQRFLSGEITNDEFNDDYPIDKADPALEAIYWNLWLYYSETHSYKLQGEHRLGADGEQLFQRCVRFLASGLEYEWPRYEWISLKYTLLRFVGLGRLIDRKFDEFKSRGDFDVWPFLRRGDYRKSVADGG